MSKEIMSLCPWARPCAARPLATVWLPGGGNPGRCGSWGGLRRLHGAGLGPAPPAAPWGGGIGAKAKTGAPALGRTGAPVWKKGGHLLSRIALQYHRRRRA